MALTRRSFFMLLAFIQVGATSCVLPSETRAAAHWAVSPVGQEVIIHIKLVGGPFGSPRERQTLFALEDMIEAAIIKAQAGELDGDQFGGGECLIYLYGPDAHALYEIARQILKEHAKSLRGYAVKRLGPVGSPIERVDW